MFRRSMIAGSLIVGALLLGMTAFARPADPNPVDGRWQGSISGPNGDMTINFTFKADGTKLTGAVATPNGDVPIEDGKIDGDKLSFNTHFQDSVIEHQGTLSGDTIQLKVKGPWGESEMTLKRVPEK